MFASHPPSQERVDANRKHAAKYPAGGELGTEAFAAAIAPTLKSKPAYDAYEEGRKALKNKHADVALAKADQAIKLVPDEGHFYALRGDADLVQKKLPSATQAYTDAISRNDPLLLLLPSARSHRRARAAGRESPLRPRDAA